MPFYQDYSDNNAIVLCWKYGDGDDFDEKLLTAAEDLEKVQHYHPKKKLEHLMVRQLLKKVMPAHTIKYKTIGEPYLWPADAHISISHSFPFAALAISSARVGIDLEKPMPKILKIKHKFLHPSETLWTEGHEHETELITVIWAIKESLYKLHTSKYWSLKKHYEVDPFDLDHLSAVKCRVFDDFFCHEFTARVVMVEDFYFAFVEDENQTVSK